MAILSCSPPSTNRKKIEYIDLIGLGNNIDNANNTQETSTLVRRILANVCNQSRHKCQ